MKKKTTKKKTPDMYIRSTPTTAKQIRTLAQQIYDRWESNCKAAGIHRPTAKLAIDYMMVAASHIADFKVSALNTKNNLYLKVSGFNQEES